jgi:hypothetical protein
MTQPILKINDLISLKDNEFIEFTLNKINMTFVKRNNRLFVNSPKCYEIDIGLDFTNINLPISDDLRSAIKDRLDRAYGNICDQLFIQLLSDMNKVDLTNPILSSVNPISEDVMKELLVDFVKNNEQHVREEFCDTDEIDLSGALDHDNWSNMLDGPQKHMQEGLVEWCFDCEPFDDQLRGYVVTDTEVLNVYRVFVVGE